MASNKPNNTNKPKAAAPAPKKQPVAVAGGKYRATCAFAFLMERIERDAIITLTAEQATALGSKVVPVSPAPAVQQDEEAGAAESGAGDKESGADASSTTGAAAPADGAAESGAAANQDQIV